MKTETRINKSSLIALLILFALLGAYTASITYQYQSIVRGILGLAVISLIILYSASSKMDASIEKMLLHPKIRDFIQVFIWSLLSYWATLQIYEMILFLLKR